MAGLDLLSPYAPLFQQSNTDRYYVITGGRGSAKSFHVAIFLLNLTYERGHVILFTRWTLTSAHISIIPEFIEKIELLNKHQDFEVTQTEITNVKTGSKILFRGIKTSQGTATANLKSIAGVTTWVLDEAEELVDEDVFDKINLSIRSQVQRNRVILVMNPAYKTHWIYERFIAKTQSDTTLIHTSYLINLANLSESFIDEANRTMVSNEHRYNHLFLGDWLETASGLLWNQQIIDRCRTDVLPSLKRKVLAIDPAGSVNKDSDYTGIIVVAQGHDKNYYLIEDLSGKYSPAEWGAVSRSACAGHGIDSVVVERNFGGDMVKANLVSSGVRTRIKEVSASRGKWVRADPIYALYEQGKVFHYGNFPILENEMITFDGDRSKKNETTGSKSPDRVDALVWGLTELSTYTGRILA